MLSIFLAFRSIEPVDGGTNTRLHYQPILSEPKSCVLPYSFEEMRKSVSSWKAGTLIQNAFPYLSASERELFLSGLDDEEWDEATKHEEDDWDSYDDQEAAF
jgi:hypothetical protein